MNWLSKILGSKQVVPKNPEEVVLFYQQMGFFVGSDPATIIQRYQDDHGTPPGTNKAWDDVFLLAYAKSDVWCEDSEADVCAENTVYSKVLPEWAAISHGAFDLVSVDEQWESEHGPITLNLQLNGRTVMIRPSYLDDWIDLEVLQQINGIISNSDRQFECAVDGNFTLVMCLTSQQKKVLKKQRQFPFAW